MRELVILLQASIEPTIPERLAKKGDEEFRSKYEVLQDERQRMREEIEDSERAKTTDPYDDLNQLESDDSQEERTNEPEDQQMNQIESQQRDTTKETSGQDQSMNQKEEDKEKAPVISDPEVNTQEVQLNLGSENESQEQGKGQSESSSEDKSKQTENSDEDGQTEVSNTTLTQQYYIVAGSFKQPDNASNYRDQLAEQGYGDAVIIRKKGNGWMFVAYNAFDDLANAQDALNEVQQENAEAWLYRAN